MANGTRAVKNASFVLKVNLDQETKREETYAVVKNDSFALCLHCISRGLALCLFVYVSYTIFAINKG